MRQARKWFLFMMILVSVLCFSSAVAAKSGKCGENLTWKLDDKGLLTISGTGEMNLSSSGSTKWEADAVRKVVIKEGATSVEERAFEYCYNLTSVTIPGSVSGIGFRAFGSCNSLTDITIRDGVTSIGGAAFGGCKGLKTVTIPGSVTSIGNYAFGGCSGLTRITLQNGVTGIGECAFEDCTALKSITIPGSVTDIGQGAFWHSYSLESVTIQEGLSCIGEYVFEDCNSLKRVTIPNSVTSIGGGAFSGCSSLTDVTIPDSVTRIGGDAFSGCSSLKSITIPGSVDYIGNQTFIGCTGLESVTIQKGVTRIAERMFSGCSSLTDIAIPGSVTKISLRAFEDCISLTGITIPKSVTEIGGFSFRGCSSLTSVTIPDSVTYMEKNVFFKCPKLKAIRVGSGNKAFCSVNGVLFNKKKTVLLAYPVGKEATSYVVPSGVTSIGDGAFSFSSLKRITIPGGVTGIGEYAFSSCTSLTGFTIPGSVEWIGADAFNRCISLKSITIPSGVIFVGDGAFDNCSSLKTIRFMGAHTDHPSLGTLPDDCEIIMTDPDEKAALSSVKFNKTSARVKEDVTITAVTNAAAVKLTLYAGGKAIKTWTDGYTDDDNKRTWKVTYSFAGAGKRTLEFRAVNAGGETSEARTAKITITQIPVLGSVQFEKAKATVKQNVTITAVTSTNAEKLNMYAGKTLAKSWTAGYKDKDGNRTWTVTYAFAGAGDRTLKFRAEADGEESAPLSAKITVTRAPTLSKVTFSKSKAKLKEKITITAVTSTEAARLTMYTGDKAVKSWTKGFTDKDGARTWKVTYAFTGAGKRTLTFRAFDANGAGTKAKSASVEIEK